LSPKGQKSKKSLALKDSPGKSTNESTGQSNLERNNLCCTAKQLQGSTANIQEAINSKES